MSTQVIVVLLMLLYLYPCLDRVICSPTVFVWLIYLICVLIHTKEETGIFFITFYISFPFVSIDILSENPFFCTTFDFVLCNYKAALELYGLAEKYIGIWFFF